MIVQNFKRKLCNWEKAEKYKNGFIPKYFGNIPTTTNRGKSEILIKAINAFFKGTTRPNGAFLKRYWSFVENWKYPQKRYYLLFLFPFILGICSWWVYHNFWIAVFCHYKAKIGNLMLFIITMEYNKSKPE